MKPAIVHSEAEFRAAVERVVEQIRHRPESFAPHGEQGARKALVRRFPYTVFFVELEATIWMVAVAHQRRKPGYWTHRCLE